MLVLIFRRADRTRKGEGADAAVSRNSRSSVNEPKEVENCRWKYAHLTPCSIVFSKFRLCLSSNRDYKNPTIELSRKLTTVDQRRSPLANGYKSRSKIKTFVYTSHVTMRTDTRGGTLNARACNWRLSNEQDRELADLSDAICSAAYRRSPFNRSFTRNIPFFFLFFFFYFHVTRTRG